MKNEYDLLLFIQVKISEVDVHKVSDGCIHRQAFLIPSPVKTYTGKKKKAILKLIEDYNAQYIMC